MSPVNASNTTTTIALVVATLAFILFILAAYFAQKYRAQVRRMSVTAIPNVKLRVFPPSCTADEATLVGDVEIAEPVRLHHNRSCISRNRALFINTHMRQLMSSPPLDGRDSVALPSSTLEHPTESVLYCAQDRALGIEGSRRPPSAGLILDILAMPYMAPSPTPGERVLLPMFRPTTSPFLSSVEGWWRRSGMSPTFELDEGRPATVA